jgi:large repetitive protein
VNTVGVYTLEYTYVDVAGNTGNIVTRTVTVEDTTAPVVTLSGVNTISVEV